MAWFTNGFVMRCSERYEEIRVCGTYIEIHKPGNPQIEEAYMLTKTFESGFSTEFISTKNLCAGRYEFWWVLRSRNGSTLQYVKPFFSIYPSCRKVVEVEPETFEDEEIEEEEEEGEVDDDDEYAGYSCDKTKDRTTKCQQWESPEERAAWDARRAEKERKKREQENETSGFDDILAGIDLESPIDLALWYKKANRELGYDKFVIPKSSELGKADPT